MTEVELYTAYTWECPNCGLGNFASPIKVEDTMYLRMIYDIPDDEEGEFVKVPEVVTCAFCYSKYETKDSRDCNLGT